MQEVWRSCLGKLTVKLRKGSLQVVGPGHVRQAARLGPHQLARSFDDGSLLLDQGSGVSNSGEQIPKASIHAVLSFAFNDEMVSQRLVVLRKHHAWVHGLPVHEQGLDVGCPVVATGGAGHYKQKAIRPAPVVVLDADCHSRSAPSHRPRP